MTGLTQDAHAFRILQSLFGADPWNRVSSITWGVPFSALRHLGESDSHAIFHPGDGPFRYPNPLHSQDAQGRRGLPKAKLPRSGGSLH